MGSFVRLVPLCPSSVSGRSTLKKSCIDEQVLRKRIQELQEYRRMGITTLAEAERYDRDKANRVRRRGEIPLPSFGLLPLSQHDICR